MVTGVALEWANTINAGAALVGILVVGLFVFTTIRDRSTRRWRELYDLADAERKELTNDLEEARKVIAEQKETMARLEALQIPAQVVQSLHDSADAAYKRQMQIISLLEKHEQRAETRHKAMLNVLDMIAEKLGPEPNGHPAKP